MNSSDEAALRFTLVCAMVCYLAKGREPKMEDTPAAAVESTVAVDAFAAAVRAEAVADERRRIAGRIHDYKMAYRERLGDDVVDRADWHSRFLYGLFCAEEIATLSPVPVATPEQRTCTWCDQPASGTAWGHLPDGPQPSCGEHGHRFQPSPVATPPAEPAGGLPKSMLINPSDFDFEDDDPVTVMGAPSRPVTCAHWKTERHVIDLSWPHKVWCPGPVSVPKESSE